MSTAANALSRPSGARLAPPLRFVTAASLFDGHDAAINIMRRLIQAQGVEVVHLGHNRSAEDVVDAALQDEVLEQAPDRIVAADTLSVIATGTSRSGRARSTASTAASAVNARRKRDTSLPVR